MEIPLIIPDKSKMGYWETYPDHKIWHDESDFYKEMSFKDYKKVGGEYGVGGSDWMQLEAGENKIRIVSDFKDYGSHYNPSTKKATICLGKEVCSLCQSGDKPRVQFLGWVIDRKDNQAKLLRIGYQIFGQIGQLANSEEYGFDVIPSYDITITKTGEGLETEYNVLAARKDTPLTDEEETMIEEKVTDPEDVIERMKMKLENAGGAEGDDDLMDALTKK